MRIKIRPQSRSNNLAALDGQKRVLAATRHLMNVFTRIFFSSFKHGRLQDMTSRSGAATPIPKILSGPF
ncbi:hypothetical protein ATN79_40720 [Paraburkholderia caribensis]|nr:hypothetical protein ATN79_40720 [Paraburkholderia caribensis]